ncbi:hypothetical protein [Peribacillus alkalitolerans]|uniref:hypothetical protein n=1 Tax=Peribacillus alkalitolerans TaxID=1550385 RepID=UPI0013D85758|nr:hypothetical protein [Peribacillus alkalitolerans]
MVKILFFENEREIDIDNQKNAITTLRKNMPLMLPQGMYYYNRLKLEKTILRIYLTKFAD